MDFEQSQLSDWLVVSELVGSHNKCWSLDIHIFHEKDKEEINCHLGRNITTSIHSALLLIYS